MIKQKSNTFIYIFIGLTSTIIYLNSVGLNISVQNGYLVELINTEVYKIDYTKGGGEKKYYLSTDDHKLMRLQSITRSDIKKYDPENLFFDPIYMRSKIRTIKMRHGGWPNASKLMTTVKEKGNEFIRRLKECDMILLFKLNYACKKFKDVNHYYTFYLYNAESQSGSINIPYSSDSVFTQDQHQLFYYVTDDDTKKGGLYVHSLKSGENKRLLYIKNIFNGRFTGEIGVHTMTLDKNERRLYFALHLGGRHMWPGYSFYGFVVYDLQKNAVIYYEIEKGVGSVQQILPYGANKFGVLLYSDRNKTFSTRDYKIHNK